jgi:outer membrane lipoprotein-sorting protein
MARASKFLTYIVLIAIVITPSSGLPYVLPPAQIIEFMTGRFVNITTLHIIQHTAVKDLSQEKETVFGEIVYLKSPYFYRSDMVGQPGKRLVIHNSTRTLRITNGAIAYDGESLDLLYRFLLLAQKPKRLLEGLQLIGIDVERVSLTRFEGRIAYLIGEKGGGGPRLLVDKDLFFPLLLEYGNARYHFSDYRQIMQQTWYPHKIVYLSKGATVEEYSIKEITVNPPVDASLFDIAAVKAQFGVSGLDLDTMQPKIPSRKDQMRQTME